MSTSSNTTISFGGFWCLAFIIIKVGGTALANWSWLWVLLPIVPILVVILKALGVL